MEIKASGGALGASVEGIDLGQGVSDRDFKQILRALGEHGVLCFPRQTLETAAFWSVIPALKAKVTEALVGALSAQGTPPLVLCHVSHVYETGASLYFTIVSAQTDDHVAQWRQAKAAASAAIAAAGGTITHHHGVGTDHREPYATEIGPLAVESLQAVKRVLDPNGILNPGILLP